MNMLAGSDHFAVTRQLRDLSLVTISTDLQMHTGFDVATLLIPANALGRAAVNMLLAKVQDPTKALPSVAIPFVFHAGHTLAPPPGFHWVFTNGQSMWLSSLSTHSALTERDAYFTRLENAPLSAAEVTGFKDRLKPVIANPDMLSGDVLRLAVDTSTGDHKQIYLLVTHDAAGAVLGTWGVECFDDCKPMEDPPWAFKVYPDEP